MPRNVHGIRHRSFVRSLPAASCSRGRSLRAVAPCRQVLPWLLPWLLPQPRVAPWGAAVPLEFTCFSGWLLPPGGALLGAGPRAAASKKIQKVKAHFPFRKVVFSVLTEATLVAATPPDPF